MSGVRRMHDPMVVTQVHEWVLESELGLSTRLKHNISCDKDEDIHISTRA